jgi:hypothetical protein
VVLRGGNKLMPGKMLGLSGQIGFHLAKTEQRNKISVS